MKQSLALIAAASLLAIVPAAVSSATDEVFTGTFTGAAEVPAVSTAAAGTVYAYINPAATRISYAVSYAGLSGPLVAAHIHAGAAGTNGQIILSLTPGPSTMFGSLTQSDFKSTSAATLWAAALNLIRTGRAYVNLHTDAHPSGEARAQLEAAAGNPTPTPRSTRAGTSTPSARPAATAGPTATGGLTLSPGATSSPRATAGAGLTASPGPTAGAGSAAAATASTAPVERSLPPTAGDSGAGRSAGIDPLPIVIVLLLGSLGGVAATFRVRPRSAPPDN